MRERGTGANLRLFGIRGERERYGFSAFKVRERERYGFSAFEVRERERYGFSAFEVRERERYGFSAFEVRERGTAFRRSRWEQASEIESVLFFVRAS